MTTAARIDHDDLVLRFGEAIRDFLTVSAKGGHTSDLFDMRRRTLIGTYAFYDHLPWLLGEIERTTTPERLGSAARTLCGTPTNFQMHAIVWGYLLARENELLLGRDGGAPEDARRVVEFWARMMLAYHEGALVPSENGDRQRVVPDALVRDMLDRHGRPAAEDREYGAVTAGLQVFNYVQRGEQRGMTYFHGPYDGDGGTTIFVEEFSRLRHDELPWTADPSPFPVDTVCAVVETEGVEFKFDLYQGMVARPPDHQSRTRRVALLTCDGDAPRPLSDDERATIVAAALQEQKRLFRAMLAWDADYKVTYGVYLYLDFLIPLLTAAGCSPAVLETTRERFADTAASRLAEILAVEPVPIWQHMFTTQGPIFTPPGAAA